MPLPILKATDPVTIDTVTVMVYGDPGAGKTSLAFTAKNPLLLDFDKGSYRSSFRKDSVPVSSWADIEAMTAADLAPYDTIVVDTAGRCLDALAVQIMRDNPKMDRGGGSLSLQGFGELKSRFKSWVATLRAYGKDVIFISHGVESKSGDNTILRPDVTGSSYGELMKIADGVAYLHMVEKQRTLEFDPQERFVGKNPANIERQILPNFAQDPDFMAKLLVATKAAMGQLSNDAKRIIEQVNAQRERIELITQADQMNVLLAEVNQMDRAATVQIKHLMKARCAVIGVVWNKDANKFVHDAPPPAEQPPLPISDERAQPPVAA